jgi:hypothetical protein
VIPRIKGTSIAAVFHWYLPNPPHTAARPTPLIKN